MRNTQLERPLTIKSSCSAGKGKERLPNGYKAAPETLAPLHAKEGGGVGSDQPPPKRPPRPLSHGIQNKIAMSPKELCRRVGISRGLLYTLWQRNRGPDRVKIAGRTLITEEALSRWLSESIVSNKVGGGS